MASPASAKKQIVESIKESTNILVTVSSNPTVDELSAALGLTIFLNKLGKHATAVASGQMPSAITFLEPDKTFEDSADSLRDFIIALDKDKADHLRYKLEGEVVKIFITPYRTKITSDDLEFSQGDYNVEMVIAVNVADENAMDMALESHGKILHDATVATITAGDISSDLGTIEWHDDTASGVSEMITELLSGLKTPKVALDEQISTALLTGIVASTERFANDLTTSRTMTAAAELMASGANQQLIAAQLDDMSDDDSSVDSHGSVKAGNKTGLSTEGRTAKLSSVKDDDDDSLGVMNIRHTRQGDLDEVARQVAEEQQRQAERSARKKLDRKIEEKGEEFKLPTLGKQHVEPSEPEEEDVSDDDEPPEEPTNQPEPDQGTPPQPVASISPSVQASEVGQMPSVGGTLNATTAQAADDKRRELEKNQNRTILKHGKPIGHQTRVIEDTPLNASMAPPEEMTRVDPLMTSSPAPQAPSNSTKEPEYQPSQHETLLAEALNNANVAQPASPPDFITDSLSGASAEGASPTLTEIEAIAGADKSGSQMTSLPPMPDFSSLPPPPPPPLGLNSSEMPDLLPLENADPAPASDFNPSQFQIPPR